MIVSFRLACARLPKGHGKSARLNGLTFFAGVNLINRLPKYLTTRSMFFSIPSPLSIFMCEALYIIPLLMG